MSPARTTPIGAVPAGSSPAAPLTRRAYREQERAARGPVTDHAGTERAIAGPTSGAVPEVPAALPSRRSVRAAAVRPRPRTRRRPAADPSAVHRVAGRPTPFVRLRDNAATAGIVLASAGLLMGAVAPSATSAPTPADGAELPLATGVAQAVTAPANATVDFGLETAGPAAEGIAPSIAGARAPSGSLTPAAKERKAFGAPVENPVVASTFGYRVDPLGGSGTELHTGLDYASACGTPVNAADAGTVVDSGWHAYGGGQRIVIDHGDGLKTTYNHLSVLEVPTGTAVQRGQLLGAVGSTGNSTGCHLHFEVLVDDEKADPQPWL